MDRVQRRVRVLPLLAYGLITGRLLLLVLSVIGIMLGVRRLTDWLTDLTDHDTAEMLIRFTTLGAAGIGLVVGGAAYQTSKPAIDEQVLRFAAACLGSFRLDPELSVAAASEAPATAKATAASML